MQPAPRKRHPWLAALLSLIMPGFGQLYCGAFVRCLVFLILCSGSGVLALLALIPRLQVSAVVIAAIEAAALALYVVSAIDAVLVARRTSPDYQLKDYNRWYAYVMLYVAVSGGHLFAALYARDHLIQPFRAPTDSMYPTIWAHDHILADKNAYAAKDPAPGDVVTFFNPLDRSQIFVKRVIAVGGDEIEIRDDTVYINGTALTREPATAPGRSPGSPVRNGSCFYEANRGARYLVYLDGKNPRLHSLAKTMVPPHACFVLGDNRDESFDSRSFGAIPLVGITGRVEFRYAPLTRMGRLEPPLK